MRSRYVPDRIDRLARPTTAVGLVVAVVLPPLLSVSGVVESELAGDAMKWGIAGVILLMVTRVESEPLSSIGFARPRLVDVGWAVVVAVVAVGAFVFTDPVVEAMGLTTRQGIPRRSLAYGVFSAVTAGITEEILFRGYPVERLTDAGCRPVVAGGLTWALFTAAHVGAGYPAGNLLQIGLAGLFVTAVYVRVRSLFPVVLGHVVVDVVGVMAYAFG